MIAPQNFQEPRPLPGHFFAIAKIYSLFSQYKMAAQVAGISSHTRQQNQGRTKPVPLGRFPSKVLHVCLHFIVKTSIIELSEDIVFRLFALCFAKG
jgi:hypothetical protein